MNNAPNLFLIGAPKAGTSALAGQLGEHPDIFLGRKELRFFDARTFYDFQEDAPIRDLQSYLSFFSEAKAIKAQFRLDASVFNMYSKNSILDILSLSPRAKFILVLRDPLEASKSMHLQRLKYPRGPLREISESFSECWATLLRRQEGRGFPADCRNRFIFRYDLLYRYELYAPIISKLISPQNLFCIDYQIFKSHPKSVHKAIFDFLGLPNHPIQIRNVNPSFIVPENAKLFEALRAVALPIAKRFPSARRYLSRAEKWIPQRRKMIRPLPDSVDDDVRAFFSDSYLAMRNICANYRINQIEKDQSSLFE
jgi:hypothetical protein